MKYAAINPAMVAVMNEILETEVNYSDDSHFMGALGAALFALERASGKGTVTAGASGEETA